tara:strand:+ start:1069 stop:1320 length:252 start_codon:yes stop_codon:yes gene_type:complete
MAIRHGNKQYFQVLLDPNRAELVQQEAAKGKQRATAWIREAVYSELKRITSPTVYSEAEAKDLARWRQSVRKQVEGRAKPKDD